MPTLDALLAIVLDGRGRYDGEEVVDDLTHALQAAQLARVSGADADLVGAALLHDVGHHPALTRLRPHTSHERLGAEVLGPVLGERAGWVVRHHVAAKRHLAATEPGYLARLSPASRASLDRQGGPAAIDALCTGWGPAALALRRWDDEAKVAGAPEPEWDELVAWIRSAAR